MDRSKLVLAFVVALRAMPGGRAEQQAADGQPSAPSAPVSAAS